MATHHSSVTTTKKPMSPSEFFAKIYGDPEENNKTSSSPSTSIQESTHQDDPSVLQLPTVWPYHHPHWHPAELAAMANWTRPFYSNNPLELPPALTALSMNIYIFFIISHLWNRQLN